MSSAIAGGIGTLFVHEVLVRGRPLLGLFSREQEPAESPPYPWWTDGSAWSGEAVADAQAVLGWLGEVITRQYVIAPRRSTDRIQFNTTMTLSSDGSNLTAVVATLFNNERHKRFQVLENFIADVFPEIRYVEVTMGEGSPPVAEVFLTLKRGGGLTVPLKQSGTGIEQALMLGTAVLTAPPNCLMLVDEPHAFLHPLAERKVLAFIRAHGEHQYVVATHSAAFLTSYPISHARLVTIEDDGSHIADAGAHRAILDELGITAADLWASGAILWVEGSSDAAIADVVVEHLVPELGVTVRPMPDAIRHAARGKKYAKSALEVSSAVTDAITPTQVRMVFLFDADERSEVSKSDIEGVTDNQARFLSVREIENCLLSKRAIHADLYAQCALLQMPTPSAEEIAADFDSVVSLTDDVSLYPAGTAGADPSRVVGSEVLQRLYRKWTKSEYDKVHDGTRLARRVVALAPELLTPLMEVIRELGSRANSASSRERL
jgi:hypothetical protein